MPAITASDETSTPSPASAPPMNSPNQSSPRAPKKRTGSAEARRRDGDVGALAPGREQEAVAQHRLARVRGSRGA